MHLYVTVRGILHQLNRWEQDLSASYYPFEYEKGKAGMLQLSIRPIRFYEIVFPEPQMMSVLRKIQPTKCWTPAYQKFIWGIRKALKLDDVELTKIPARITTDAFCHNDIDCVAIGTKKDRYEDGIERL